MTDPIAIKVLGYRFVSRKRWLLPWWPAMMVPQILVEFKYATSWGFDYGKMWKYVYAADMVQFEEQVKLGNRR